MLLRLQYSFLTLLLFTTACAVVIAYVVIPWRHDREQSELITRLRNYEDGIYQLRELKENSLELEYIGSEPKYFDYFLEHAAKCERVQTILFERENFTTEQLAKLKSLPRLEKLHIKYCNIAAQRMKTLGDLPLKELYLGYLDKLSFETWPIQPQLELLTLEVSPDFAPPPLVIHNHPKLQDLNLDCVPQIMSIENCPELKAIAIDGNVITKLKLNNLPKLETLSLGYWSEIDSASQIEELPALKHLSIYPAAYRHFQHHKLSRLQSFACTGGRTSLDKDVLERIFHLPELQGLALENDWLVLMSNGLRIPNMPRLKRLTLEGSYSNKGGRYQVPEQLVLQFLQMCPSLELISLSLENTSDTLLQEIAHQENLQTLILHLNENGKLGDTSVLNNCQKFQTFMVDGMHRTIAPPKNTTTATKE